ncbi:histidine kinase dimerization/phosphoacceptor domain -containing protein [Rhizobium sp. EC-SD404]|uniref:sensor histidine kinase n=1 Tax=Rhizobium sp. EC-SD404 TaxID=2038389 RepID=UPI0012518E94|nr:histidine kinase dimerization/phosphoacceptor domain -containing protein [Rhizobium sp. EC-SD404]VVT27347.1 Signal transduction histidine kinase [Rhizobium sp. EC-SD404]
MLDRTETLRASPAKRWLFAVIAFGLAFGARFWLEERLPPGFPYLTFFPAVILTTFFVGLAPGIAVGVASFFAAWFFFIAPIGSFELNGPAIIALAFFVAIVTVDVLLIHWMHVALDRLKREQMVSHRHAEERDVLFKEMQHRVSNNLAVVSALLNAQKRSLPEGEAATALAQAATRVNLVARMQRELYDPAHQSLDFAAYLKALGPDILEAMGARHVTYDAQVTAIDVSSDMAVPLGLIATELISNSVEHAFAQKRQGTISVNLAQVDGSDGAYVMRVRDDGPGWPDAFKPDTSRNLGMRIVMSLAQQIGGQFSYHNDGGAVSSLAFRIDGRKA